MSYTKQTTNRETQNEIQGVERNMNGGQLPRKGEKKQ
jgi:hypothetical protein